VGSPRTGLLTSTSSLAAASASRVAADSLASSLRCMSALLASVGAGSKVARHIAAVAHVRRATTTRDPLLPVRAGRHPRDGALCAHGAHRSVVPAPCDTTVKNLRIVASAVLLLNFNEVRSLHFCSTGVTV
jgi:hypothetical protein